jgi:hypothetical protein
MTHAEMTDAEVRAQVERTEAFISQFIEMVAEAIVDPAGSPVGQHGQALQRIAATVDRVEFVTFANLANLNAAMGGHFMSVIELYLQCAGLGPTLDYRDATEFLAKFEAMIWKARKLRMQ